MWNEWVPLQWRGLDWLVFNVYYKILIHDRDNFWLFIGYNQNPAGI